MHPSAHRLSTSSSTSSWTCRTCTFVHEGKKKEHFLVCEVCGSDRKDNKGDNNDGDGCGSTSSGKRSAVDNRVGKERPLVAVETAAAARKVATTATDLSFFNGGDHSKNNQKAKIQRQKDDEPQKCHKDETTTTTTTACQSTASTAWGSLRPPRRQDICPPRRKRQKALDAPPPMLDYLVVLDFEWTASNKHKMLPVAEITQFPSVLLKLHDGKLYKDNTSRHQQKKENTILLPPSPKSNYLQQLPKDLIRSDCDVTSESSSPSRRRKSDAYCISIFDTFVQPTLNPKLTPFSIELTGITQAQVDVAPTIDIALQQYLHWLASNHLMDSTTGNKIGNWQFATWGDVDVMTTLRLELQHKQIDLPSCFQQWINLKEDAMFKRHYHREPRGGLRTCVESVGAIWEGRAHNGLIDSINTAKIVRHMVQTGFRFTRATRGLDRFGVPFGQKKNDADNKAEQKVDA